MSTTPTVPKEPQETNGPVLMGTPLGWGLSLVLATLGAYLLVYHTSHIILALPYVLLLACPLMHLFMHRRHGHQQGGVHDAGHSDSSRHTP